MGTKIEPQEETKLRRFKDYGLSGATGGLGRPSKGSCQQGPEKQWTQWDVRDWRPWVAT